MASERLPTPAPATSSSSTWSPSSVSEALAELRLRFRDVDVTALYPNPSGIDKHDAPLYQATSNAPVHTASNASRPSIGGSSGASAGLMPTSGSKSRMHPAGVQIAIEENIEGFMVEHDDPTIFDLPQIQIPDHAGDYWTPGQALPQWSFSERDFARPEKFTQLCTVRVLVPAFIEYFQDHTWKLLARNVQCPDDLQSMQAYAHAVLGAASHLGVSGLQWPAAMCDKACILLRSEDAWRNGSDEVRSRIAQQMTALFRIVITRIDKFCAVCVRAGYNESNQGCGESSDDDDCDDDSDDEESVEESALAKEATAKILMAKLALAMAGSEGKAAFDLL